MKILYLGLRPRKGTYHYPVIRTEKTLNLEPILDRWERFTHIIFTSKTSVEYWPGPWDKKLIAIGKGTKSLLETKGKQVLVAPFATQEGVAKLIKNFKGIFFYPHSNLARPFLAQFMREKKIPFLEQVLYETVFQKIEPVVDLDPFDEIIFTSPSTVFGFLRIYGALPKEKKLTAIGPITKAALDQGDRGR